METNRKVTIPFAFHKEEETGRIDNFVRAAKSIRGESFENHKYPPYPFDDSDVYKVIEGASYTLSVQPDPKLDSYLDDLIAKIGAAQEKMAISILHAPSTLCTRTRGPEISAGFWKESIVTNFTTSAICMKRRPRTTRRPANVHCSTSRFERRICSIERSVQTSRLYGPGTRLLKWVWQSSTVSPAIRVT